ncbi:MAG: B12-binding domain-containing radical SAM protein [Omnitrophica bacterium]|nr:B12-binding domain-containing radical SAM protein [Candidatus Omnitrophota bacterium]
MKTLLVSLQKDMNAVGLKYLHFYLLKKEYNSHILFLPNFNPADINHLEAIRCFVREINPGLIGISLMSTEYYKARSLTRYLKNHVPSVPVIWGGIHPTISPEHCLECADYVCIGEGERTIVAIVEAISAGKDIKRINNLCYLEGGAIRRNALNPLVDNLDEIVSHEQVPQNSYILANGGVRQFNRKLFMTYDRYLGKSYITRIGRGCFFSCTYCCNNFITRLYGSNRIRKRSMPNVIEELAKALKDSPQTEYFGFMDDCFLAYGDEYLREFCRIYKERIGKPFAIQAIPVFITRDKLEILKDAGLAWISVGLQSGSDRVCKEVYKRKSLRSHFLKASSVINDLGIAAYYDLILDNPFETEKDSLETIETLIETPKPFYMDFYSLACYSGTELHEKLKREYPQCVDDYLSKDYLLPHSNAINVLIRSSAFIDRRIMKQIVRLYKKNPRNLQFKILLHGINLLTLFIFAPLTYLQVIRLSQRGSYLKTFRMLPTYFKLIAARYMNQFKGILVKSEVVK